MSGLTQCTELQRILFTLNVQDLSYSMRDEICQAGNGEGQQSVPWSSISGREMARGLHRVFPDVGA